jgi:hypothetical protein
MNQHHYVQLIKVLILQNGWLNETTLALELQEIKLKSANKVHNEWFGDDKSRVYLAKSNRAIQILLVMLE